MSQSATSRRAALRAQQEAEERAKRTRKMVGIGAAIVAALVALILAVTFWQGARAAGAAITPPHAVVNQYGVQAGTNAKQAKDGIAIHGDKAKADAPVVQLFADYQCPGCKNFDNIFGEELNKLAEAGDIKYSVQIETFLDRFGANKSTDPAIAAACADTVGAFPAYHLAIFKHQPEQEGAGYTVDQLTKQIPAEAGIAGDNLTKFQQCFNNRQTAGFVSDENQYNTAWTGLNYQQLSAKGDANADGWGSTPLITVNGKRLDHQTLDATNPASIADAIKKLAAS